MNKKFKIYYKNNKISNKQNNKKSFIYGTINRIIKLGKYFDKDMGVFFVESI
jgi:hypothetical protein